MKSLFTLALLMAFLSLVDPTRAQNTTTGTGALTSITTGKNNVADGSNALHSDLVGADNTAIGFDALQTSTGGADNTAAGSNALQANMSGSSNTGVGYEALYHNLTGGGNVASGSLALYYNTKGNFNVGSGYRALYANTTGNSNTAVGDNAGSVISTGSNNIDIGANVVGTLSDTGTIRIGMQGNQKATYIAGIQGQTTAAGAAVYIDSTGKLGTLTSSRRFKDDIRQMGSTSDVLLSLQPVTYHYKPQIDPKGTAQFGLVAEDVARVDPDLVVPDADGKPYSVRYEAVNAMLLNEFLKEHRRVQKLEQEQQVVAIQQATIASQAEEISAQQKQLNELEAKFDTLAYRVAQSNSH
jgi:Chaperone of endosialidase